MFKEIFYAFIATLLLLGITADPVFSSSFPTGNEESRVMLVQEGGRYFSQPVQNTQGTVVGESVILSSNQGSIIATPHTLYDSGWVKVDFISTSISGDVEISFGFNGIDQVQMIKGESWQSYAHEKIRYVDGIVEETFAPANVISETAGGGTPTIGDASLNPGKSTIVHEENAERKTDVVAYTNETDNVYTYKKRGQIPEIYYETYTDWKDLNSVPKTEFKSLSGASKWNTLKNDQSILKNTWYSARFWVEIPFKGTEEVSGKYNIAVKSAGADLNTAIVLDPWYSSVWPYRKQLLCYGSSNSTVTNYQKLIRVYNTTATDTAENIAQYTTGSLIYSPPPFYGVNVVMGQTFTAETTATAKKVWWRLIKYGTPTNIMYCTIRGVTAGLPNATVYATGSINTTYIVSNNTYPTGNWYEFDMGTGASLTAGSVYAVTWNGTVSNSSYVTSVISPSMGYTNGNYTYSTDGGTTWSNGGDSFDCVFQVLSSTTGTTPLRIGCGGYSKSDFSDLRFTKSDGSTLLDYWIENYTTGASAYADVWVELDTIPQMTGTNQNQTFYMYYGNSGASSVSNGTNTFIAFDDFERGSTGDAVGGNWTSKDPGNYATINTTRCFSGTRSVRIAGNSSSETRIALSVSNFSSKIIRLKQYKENASRAAIGTDTSSRMHWLYIDENENTFYPNSALSYTDTGIDVVADTWQIIEKYAISDVDNTTRDRINNLTAYELACYNSVWSNTFFLGASNMLGGGGFNNTAVFFDDVCISNYTLPQPLWGATSSAETFSAPTISTILATTITNTTAVLGGNVTAMGSGNVSQYGIQYGTSSSYGTWINSTETKTAVFSWTNTTTGLTPGQGYYYNVFVNDTVGGISNGSPSTFLTAPNPPNTFTTSVNNGTSLNLTWVMGTGATNVTVRYNTTAYPTTTNGTDGTTIYNGPLTYFLHTGLSTGTTYRYAIWSQAINSTLGLTQYSTTNATASGTPITVPTVVTIAATTITNSGATLGGNITDLGGDNVRYFGFQYGTSGSYGSTVNTSADISSVPYSWINTTSGLNPGTGYYFRAFAQKEVGTGYGSQLAFLTLPNAPTSFAAVIYNATALNITWTKGTGSANTTVRYNTTTYPTTLTGTDGTTIYNSTGSNYLHTGLTTGTTYYYSAWSWITNNTLALTQYSSTNVTTSATPADAPTVVTIAATTITNSGATLGGNITSLGGSNVNYFGFEYGTSGSYGSTMNNSATISGVPYSWTNVTSGLDPGTGYYFRSFAQNSIATGYGSQLTFLTAPNPPVGFSASAYNSTALNLTWTKGAGATNTTVRYNTTTYPTTLNGVDGTTIFNSTANTYLHTGLSTGTTYYYSAWAWTVNGTLSLTQYSITNVTASGVPAGVPVLTTIAATSIIASGATLGGNITSLGGSNVNYFGFEYGTSGSYGSTMNNSATISGVPYSWTNVTSGLDPGTGYYFRSFAQNVFGIGYGAQSTFLTAPNPPTLFSASVNNLTSLNLTWTTGAGMTNTLVRYNTTAYPTTTTGTDGTTIYNSTSNSYLHTGLTTGTTYYYSAWSWTSNGTLGLTQYSVTNATVSGVPVNNLPTVTTVVATSITASSAILNGSITSLGGADVDHFGFEYGTSGAYGSTTNNSATISGVPYSWGNITAVNPGDVYYFRTFASNVFGAGYGSQLNFMTIPNAPSNFTATSLTPTSVNLTWITATCGAGTTVYTFVRYSTSGYPSLTNGTALCNVSTSYYDGFSGLTPGLTYYFRSWTQVSEVGLSANSTSTGQDSFLAYGNPTVVGYSASSLTASTITFPANVTNTGGRNITIVGARYGTVSNTYTDWSNQSVNIDTAPYPFTASMIGLTAGQAYFYQAFTVNLAGFGNGTEYVNVTKPYLPTVFTATVTTPTSLTLSWTVSAVAAGSVGYTYIRYQENTYPTTPTEGTLLYNGTASTTVAYSLTPGHTYYFSAWALALDNATGLWSTYSDTYATAYATPSYATGYTGPAVFENSCTGSSSGYPVYGVNWASQTFNVTTDAHTVSMVKLKLLQTGSCGGVTVAIKRTVAGLPYGPDIGTGTLSSSVISTAAWGWYDFEITSAVAGVTDVSLESNTQYAIVISAMSGTSNNTISVFNATSTYTGGSLCTSVDGSYTWIANSKDICFEVWGYPCLEMISAKVYSSYINSGDWLAVCHYRDVYPPYFPAQDPKQYFVLQIIHGSTVVAQSAVQKWGYMPGSIYMSSVTIAPLEWGHDYRMRISGTYANAPYAEQVIAPADWIGPDLVRLDSYLISIATLMESYYSAQFTSWATSYGQIFNTEGGVIFSMGVPYLMTIRPNLFPVSSAIPPTPTGPTGTQQLKAQYTWTTMLGPYVSEKLTQVGEPFGGIDGQTVGAIFTILVYILVAGFAFMAGQSGAAIFLAFPIFLGGGLLGIIPLPVMFIALAIASFLLIYHVWLGRA